jgi:citrate synthase
MEYNDMATGEANTELAKRLVLDRSDWKSKVTDLVELLKEMATLAECQVLMLSYRQILLDKITDFKTTKHKRQAAYDRYYKLKYREYSINYDIKLSSGEKVAFIKADLSHLRNQMEMLQSHMDYYQECIKTLDNLAFAIRNRINLNDKEY